jgi:hypothetical protein
LSVGDVCQLGDLVDEPQKRGEDEVEPEDLVGVECHVDLDEPASMQLRGGRDPAAVGRLGLGRQIVQATHSRWMRRMARRLQRERLFLVLKELLEG